LESIVIRGARENNLKNIDVTIPRDQLVVITGPSGSGKSTLAFDTIYAEGRRRYVESLSAYARQFLGRMDKPDVDDIEGLSPAISIDQKGSSHNPRSTVGTVTEIYDYLRLLFARIGHPHCYKCGRSVASQTVQQIAGSIMEQRESRLMLLAPQVIHKKGEHKDILEKARQAGFVRVRIDGEVRDLDDPINLNKSQWHTIELVVDRLIINDEIERTRVVESVETSLRFGLGHLVTVNIDTDDHRTYSEQFACTDCAISFPEIEPRTFSFNSPHGACTNCSGLGIKLVIDPELIIPDRKLSIMDGALKPWAGGRGPAGFPPHRFYARIRSVADKYGFSPTEPMENLPPHIMDMLLYGGDNIAVTMRYRTRRGRELEWETRFEGLIPELERRYRETTSDYVRSEIERFMTSHNCQSCQGARLKPEALAVTIANQNIDQICGLSVEETATWIETITGEEPPDPYSSMDSAKQNLKVLTKRELIIARLVLKEIEARISFLLQIGLDYLTLSRSASTLSGGESQRIRLATQIGSGLMGVLYVCDEPSVGLHAVDNHRLIGTLQRLRDLGNTVIIVEHDETVMRAADHLIDLGPGAGELGGYVVAEGSIEAIESAAGSMTGAYLSGRIEIAVPTKRRPGTKQRLRIKNATANNLQNVNVDIPLGNLVCVTGVSGSGKSTLIYEVLYKWLAQNLHRAKDKPGSSDGVDGLDYIDKVINIDQNPIGRTPRSNPATYTGTFTIIRELFAALPESKARGYGPGRFSFNVKGGRCEACAGDGYIHIQMQFLPDVTVPCEICLGRRYNDQALDIEFKGKNIADVLGMTVTEALSYFEAIPRLTTKLKTLNDVGLGYIRLGQPATTLSGGEAQRVKLSTELSKRATGKTLYILDEPTTGLAFDDCAHLLTVLHRLVDQGNSVLIIEHHMDLIKNADWVIDLGPGAGHRGGHVVATGIPEVVAEQVNSQTAPFLKKVLPLHSTGRNPIAKSRRAQKAAAR
jgi:excinuclease ABC subunit A